MLNYPPLLAIQTQSYIKLEYFLVQCYVARYARSCHFVTLSLCHFVTKHPVLDETAAAKERNKEYLLRISRIQPEFIGFKDGFIHTGFTGNWWYYY